MTYPPNAADRMSDLVHITDSGKGLWIVDMIRLVQIILTARNFALNCEQQTTLVTKRQLVRVSCDFMFAPLAVVIVRPTRPQQQLVHSDLPVPKLRSFSSIK